MASALIDGRLRVINEWTGGTVGPYNWQPALATALDRTTDNKLGNVAATQTSQLTCPDTCPFKPVFDHENGRIIPKGCYFNDGKAMVSSLRLWHTDPYATADAIYDELVEKVDRLDGRRHIRYQIGGDWTDDENVKKVAAAHDRYSAKHGMRGWTYSHHTKNLDRASFGNISVLASCETPDEVRDANVRGYAAAIVVEEFPNGAKAFDLDGVTAVPCPNQINKRIKCSDCMLCSKDKVLLERGLTVAFRAHGREADQVREAVAKKNRVIPLALVS